MIRTDKYIFLKKQKIGPKVEQKLRYNINNLRLISFYLAYTISS